MLSRACFVVLTVLIPAGISAQGENNHWLFSFNTGLDFMESPPVVFSNHAITNNARAAAAISTASGDLLCYSDGSTVWNGDHIPLQNGTGLYSTVGGPIQGGLMVPWAGHPNELYLFWVNPMAPPEWDPKAMYHRLDMNTNGGQGSVEELNKVLWDSATTVITAIPDAYETGIWILLHDLWQPRFLAFKLDASGLDTVPVISTIGTPEAQGVHFTANAYLRPNTLGDRIVWKKTYSDLTTDTYLETFSFDRATGQVADRIRFDGPARYYAGELSPSGDRAYFTESVCAGGIASRLWQYDLSLLDSATIQASKQLVYESPVVNGSCNGMQGRPALGPDGRIYIAVNGQQHLAVIDQPDLANPMCLYEHQGLYLDGDTCQLNLPNTIRRLPLYTGVQVMQGITPLALSPNPASDHVRLVTGSLSVDRVDLLDLTGRLVKRYHTTLTQHVLVLDRGTLPTGVYILRAYDRLRQVGTARVVFD